MPFQKGHPPYSNGRPRKGESLKELLGQVGADTKRELVKVAYQRAIAGEYHWAEWIARHSGEGANWKIEVEASAPWVAMMSSIRAQLVGQTIDAEYEELPSGPRTPLPPIQTS